MRTFLILSTLVLASCQAPGSFQPQMPTPAPQTIAPDGPALPPPPKPSIKVGSLEQKYLTSDKKRLHTPLYEFFVEAEVADLRLKGLAVDIEGGISRVSNLQLEKKNGGGQVGTVDIQWSKNERIIFEMDLPVKLADGRVWMQLYADLEPSSIPIKVVLAGATHDFLDVKGWHGAFFTSFN